MVDVAGSIGGVLSPVLEVGKWLAAPIWRQFKYLYKYSTNFKKLEKEVKKLKNTRDEVQHKVTVAERNVEEIKQNVKDWLKDVEKTITEAEQLIQEKINNPPCFKGLCSNYKQSKKAFKLKWDDIDHLLQQEKEFDQVSFPTIQQDIWLRSREDYLAFESRNSIMKNVWDALNDENVYMIGVYGMGGTGKTTLVQEVGRKAAQDNLFEDIAFVEVTQTLDIKKVQTEIAEKLGVKFSHDSERANKLYERLKRGKKILLILDNIWEDVDLRTIGIPSEMDHGGCKLMFTTRNLDALQKMGSTNNFKMSILEENEAWNLFRKMAGDVIQTCELNSLPNDVCKECGGLPIVICTIAKALRNKSHPTDWKVALQELRAPSPKKFIGFLEKEYMKMALSYNYLRDEELKKTFLISSLMGNNTSISDLFKHVVCLDILEGANLTMQDARDRLDKLVRDLKDASLLLDGFRSEQFSMHDAVRVVAITIAYVDHHVFTAKNDIEREWKDSVKLKKCTKISLHGSSTIISQIWPNDLDCPALEYFYMPNSYFRIPEDFFTVMPKFKVLNLFRLHRLSLPSSLHLLKNLQTLCLDNSTINDVVVVGKLKKLKVLSLKHSFIKELSEEIGQLTELKLLDLSNCKQLKVIVPNVISKLLQLEEFHIKGCPIQWKVEVLKELKLLSNLTSVELDVRDNNVLPKNLFAKEPKRYKISVGDCSVLYQEYGELEHYGEHELLRMLEFKFNSIRSLEELYGFKNVELLCLAESSEDQNYVDHSNFDLQSNEIMPLFNEKGIFTNFKALVLYNISLEKIWDSRISTPPSQNLKRLTLKRCGKMTYVFPFSIAKSLRQLQCLEIINCEVLEKIVEEEGAELVVNSIFPQVTKLVLKKLPKLTIFYLGIQVSELPMLKWLEIENCQKFTPRYLGLQNDNTKGELQISESKFIRLEHKEISLDFKYKAFHSDNSTEICYNQHPTSFYQNLTQLVLWNCGNIKYAFPPSIVKTLHQLQQLMIGDCKVLEEIVAKEEGVNVMVNFVFPNLTLLKLENLPNLTVFYHEMHTSEWPKLKELVVRNCAKYLSFKKNNEEIEFKILDPKSIFLEDKINSHLEVFELRNDSAEITWQNESKTVKILWDKSAYIPLGPLQRFHNLKELQLIGCNYREIKRLSDLPSLEVLHVSSCEKLLSPLLSTPFQNLKVLKVQSCRGLVNLITPSTAGSLVQLRELKISECHMLIEIIENEGDATLSGEQVVFNNLNKLSLEYLDSLSYFCSGNYSFNFSSLEELIIEGCFNMKYFCQGMLSTPMLHKINYGRKEVENEGNDLNSTIQQLYKEKVDSNIKTLKLNGRDIMAIWQGEFQENLCIVETLELIKDEYTYIPIQILQKFVSLENLILKVCSYEELFSFKEGEEDIGVFTNFETLELRGLFNLKSISNQDSRLNSILQNLHSLYVNYCHNLTTLLLPSQSFENLRTLSVHHCNGMQNLMTSSITRSLMCLESLSIEKCEMMVEVLANEGDISNGEVVFRKLKELYLFGLESLTHFYYGNYTLKFPFLEGLYVSRCSKMKTFSSGGLSMPRLSEVNWKSCSSDLNSIIQQLQNDCAKLWERFPY
ncbi:probable disease resistance protein At4g27220 isoform X3 [Mangifera indica]|uniref:probable disease resistance protein At4g27220 isoform X3 n=1 Tax=Mangifera indica TaxID=29780 RepID=UPI001CFBCD47|nr:probable disease resistance protein At4g27220 isoform X3 [Mangifera indica]